MFHFPTLASHTYGFSMRSFGNPGINARLTAPPGFSQPSTPFIAFQRQDIPRTPLVTWPRRFMPLDSTRPQGLLLDRLAFALENGSPWLATARRCRASVREKNRPGRNNAFRGKPLPALSSKTKMPLGTIKLSKISRPTVARVRGLWRNQLNRLGRSQLSRN
jgi:hypothetical protein